MALREQLKKEKGIEEIREKYEMPKMKCPVCGKELEHVRRYTKYELKKKVKAYMIDGSPPEHGVIYKKTDNAA